MDGDRWYGRGTADNKGQHTINIAALGQVLAGRAGSLGCNVKWLIETGEETGSPGLRAVCEARARTALAADFVHRVRRPAAGRRATDDVPGLARRIQFRTERRLREGAHHSGNWGGLIANPGTILANAIASLVDARGVILCAGLRPPPIPMSVRRALASIEPGEPAGPPVDRNWGEPGLTPAERVFAWNSLEVLAFKTGSPEHSFHEL